MKDVLEEFFGILTFMPIDKLPSLHDFVITGRQHSISADRKYFATEQISINQSSFAL